MKEEAESKQRVKRAKRIRREAREKSRPCRIRAMVDPVEADVIDEYNEAAVKEMVARTPEVRFRHSSHFTDDEDRIIAAGLKTRIALYKIADSLRCCVNTLKKHIGESPTLAEIAGEARERECGEVREAVADLIKMRHPQVVMWRARQLMPQEFGDQTEQVEDDTRIVIGAIPDEMLAEADRTLRLAATEVPRVGLSAVMEVESAQNHAEGGGTPPVEVRSGTAEGKEGADAEGGGGQESPATDDGEDGMDDGFGDDDGFMDGGGGFDDLGF